MNLDVLQINERSNIAISTLWTRKEVILNKLPLKIKEKINLIGTTYTSSGIIHILKTLAKNPHIDTIILFGADLSNSGDYLMRVFGKKDISAFSSDEKLKLFVNKIKIIDLRSEFKKGNFKALEEAILKNFQEKEPEKPIDINIEDLQFSSEGWYRVIPGAYIFENSIFRAKIKILDLIKRYGVLLRDKKRYVNVLLSLDATSMKDISEILPSKEQINSENIYWTIFEGGIDFTVIIPDANVMALEEIVENVIRKCLKIKEDLSKDLGAKLYINSISILFIEIHYLKSQTEEVEGLLMKYGNMIGDFIEDPRGNFVLYLDGNRVVIEHRTPDHLYLIERGEFRNFWDAYRFLKNDNLYTFPIHALYVGKELSSAFEKLKKGKFYEQGKA